MAYELSQGSCFDLPARSFHRPAPGLDLGVRFHSERVANSAGPAAGPQSQLAQNIVLSYLAGGRVIELKTVQTNDQLRIPRPCIDATNIGFNIEWSQELRLAQSLDEYVKAWLLLWSLRTADLGLGLSGPHGDFLFDMSVGYDFEGIRSAPVRAFLDGMLQAGESIDQLWSNWPRDLLGWRPERDSVPNRLSTCITLSTFHGCPADEIERICEHLLTSVGVHVVVKLNPMLLGYENTVELLNGHLGYSEIRPHRESFDRDLDWDEALGLVRRLQGIAQRQGLFFGAKFSNTLVVENHKSFFPASEKVMYLSGAPLHVLTLELCRRFREAYRDPLPISFSAGVDSRNYPDCVACGFVPVTTCTDLLKPGGYARLPRYLDNLASRMRARGVETIADLVLAESNRAERAAGPEPFHLSGVLHQASLENHAAAAQRALSDPRYRAANNRAIPRRLGSKLWFFDCISCDKCIPVCPNDANFSIELPASLTAETHLPDLVVHDSSLVEQNERIFKLKDSHQLASFADFCNECGNCDVFCPEEGGPYLIKPRFFGSREQMEAAPPSLEGFAVEREPDSDRIIGRHEGEKLCLELDRERNWARYDDGAAVVELSFPDFARRKTVEIRPHAAEGHVVRLDRARALAALLYGVLAEGSASPVIAPFLPARQPPPEQGRA
jgi:putative selenate reductase